MSAATSKPAARRERERQEMRELILDAAMKIFTEESFASATMRRIAEEIEYAPGAIYSYFKDKDEILYALHLRGFEMLFERLRAVSEQHPDPVERLRAIAGAYLAFGFEFPQHYELMFINDCPGRVIEAKDEWEPGMRAHKVLRDTVVACIEAGRMERTDPDVAAFACWSSVHGMVSLMLKHRCSMIPEGQRQAVLDAALSYLIHRLT